MRLHNMPIVVILLAVVTVNPSTAARILAVVFSPSYSHQLTFRPLWRGLAKRGHDITLLTTDPIKDDPILNDRVRQIDLHGTYEVMEQHQTSKLMTTGLKNLDLCRKILAYWDALDDAANWQLGHPDVRALIQNKSEHFDLIITEIMNPIHMAFVDRFNVPFIGLASLDAPYRIHDTIGNYMHPVVYPDYFYPYIPPFDFNRRIQSITLNWLQWFVMKFRQYPQQTAIARKHFGQQVVRPLGEIEKDMSFLFINVNPVFHRVRPLGLNTIIIGGGTHVERYKKPLPQDLQAFMDNAKEGVIYVSFGTNVKSIYLEDSFKQNLMRAFAALPYKIIWKFENDHIDDLPGNVKIVKWLPQQDLLGHPNLKLFVTQCGLQSIEEAIFNHVPMVGISFMGDQFTNGQILEAKGLGFSFHRNEFTKESLEKAIIEVMSNPKYRENVIKMSELSKDVLVTGEEKAVFWTEYCIRTNGAKHLRSPIIDTPFYQFYLLDVIGFFVLVLLVIIFLMAMLIKMCLSHCRRKKSKTD